jgi:hypothetical protein
MSTQGGQGPDLSRIVSLILQNPDLIKQIEALAGQEEKNEEADLGAAAEVQTEPKTVSASVPMQAHGNDKRQKRAQLLTALRPYVSEKRSKTIDSLLGMVDLIDLMGRG